MTGLLTVLLGPNSESHNEPLGVDAGTTSCAGGRLNMPHPLQVNGIFVFMRQVSHAGTCCSGMLAI